MEYPSPKLKVEFDTIEEAARFYLDAFDAQWKESVRCQNALIEIRDIAAKRKAKTKSPRDMGAFARIWKIADDQLNFSTVGEGVEENAGFAGEEE